MGKRPGRHFYLLCTLPELKDFGSVPPIKMLEFLSIVKESEGPVDVVKALLLSEDLLERETVLAEGQDSDTVNPTVLSIPQVRAENALPDFLNPEQQDQDESLTGTTGVDTIWQNYFQYVHQIARISRTRFLRAWVGFEVGLRNALAKTRAKALELDPIPYLVAQELGNPASHFESILTVWTAAANPLEGLAVLDRARWDWVMENESWYSFSHDEIAAYTVKILILHRWGRINENGKTGKRESPERGTR